MKIIDARYEILRFEKEVDVDIITRAYCKCYKRDVPKTYEEKCNFIRKHRKHESPLEHSIITVDFTINRGISHEIVRHRHCAVTQESTRYCNYSADRFDNQLTFIKDSHAYEDKIDDIWEEGLRRVEKEYLTRIDFGQTPEEARGCLPIDLATNIMISTNFREWRNIFKLRCDSPAHYQMREVMTPLLHELQNELPCVFDDIPY